LVVVLINACYPFCRLPIYFMSKNIWNAFVESTHFQIDFFTQISIFELLTTCSICCIFSLYSFICFCICIFVRYSDLLSVFQWGWLLLSFETSLYILATSPLLDICFSNIFSKLMACLLILLIFWIPDVINCNDVYLSICSFMDYVFGGVC